MSIDESYVYSLEPELSGLEFQSILQRSTLAARRPADDLERLASMLKQAQIVLTCRTHAGLLVGISRAITDYAYCTYLSDLAVDVAYQKRGIGKALIERTHQAAGLGTTLILLSAPAAQTYYPHIGMDRHESCWIIRAIQ